MHFRLLAADGRTLEEGEGTAEIANSSLVVSSGLTAPLRVLPADIAELLETERPYGLLVRLNDGSRLELTMLGRMRGQIMADLRDARATRLTADLHAGGLGTAASFNGAADEVPAEFNLYDDALVVVGSIGDPERIPYSFITGLVPDGSGYRLSLQIWGREAVVIGRLGARTTEFRGLLEERVTGAAVRTSSFLAALLPGLGSLELRNLASSLRDGLAAPRERLDSIDFGIWPALITAATLPDRLPALRYLESLGGEMWLGFTQMTSVERPAVGVEAWHDSTRPQNFYGHGGDYVGFGGLLRGSVLADGPSPALWLLGYSGGSYGYGGGSGHTIKPRADVSRGRLTPASTDYDALTVAGDAPPVLAFVICRTPGGRVLYEVLNLPRHATYVYASTDVPALNRALDLIRFHVSAVYADDGPASAHRAAIERLPALRVLRDAYVGRAVHTPNWPDQIQRLNS